MSYFLWGWRGNLKLITLRSERVHDPHFDELSWDTKCSVNPVSPPDSTFSFPPWNSYNWSCGPLRISDLSQKFCWPKNNFACSTNPRLVPLPPNNFHHHFVLWPLENQTNLRHYAVDPKMGLYMILNDNHSQDLHTMHNLGSVWCTAHNPHQLCSQRHLKSDT